MSDGSWRYSRASDLPKYFGGNRTLAMHGCKGHCLKQHGQKGAALLAREFDGLELALHTGHQVNWPDWLAAKTMQVQHHTFLS